MAYIRTTEDEYTLQGNYGFGWEDLTAEDNRQSIKERRKEYRENEPSVELRIVSKRIPIEK